MTAVKTDLAPRTHSTRRLAAASVGQFGEIYDFAVFGFSIPILASLFFPGTDPVAAVLSIFAVYAVAFFARPVGGLLFGTLADRIGRIRVLAATVWLMAGGTMAIGLLPTYGTIGIFAPILLVLARLAQGLAMGGETTGSSSYALESAPDAHRGLWIGITWFFGFVPNAAAAVMLLLLRQVAGEQAYTEWVWRLPFLLGGLIGVIGFWLRSSLDDPEEFKAARSDSAEDPLRAAVRSGRAAMLHVVLLQPVLAVGAYILLGFMFTFLVRQGGLDSTTALLSNAAAIMVMAIFMPISGLLSDRFGRKPILSAGALWVALFAYPSLMVIAGGGVTNALLGQSLLAIGVGLYGGAAFTAMPEVFPTSYRATGHAISYQLSVAIFGGTTPFVATWLVGAFDSPLAPGIYASMIGIFGLVAVQFVPETRGARLRGEPDRHAS